MRVSPDNYAQYDGFPDISLVKAQINERGLLGNALLSKSGEITLPVGTIITFTNVGKMKVVSPLKVKGTIVGNSLIVEFNVFENTLEGNGRKKRKKQYTGNVIISPSAVISDKVDKTISHKE